MCPQREKSKPHIIKVYCRLLEKKVHLILAFHILKFCKKSPIRYMTGMKTFDNTKDFFSYLRLLIKLPIIVETVLLGIM